MDIATAVQHCRTQALAYLDGVREIRDDAQFWRHSATHEPDRDPGFLLYGTWAGVFASVLLGADAAWSDVDRRRIVRGLSRFQRPDGSFLLPTEASHLRGGHDDEYLVLHCTNYAVGALRAMHEMPPCPLTFLRRFTDEATLAAWLERRDWSRPWTEGNNVVNIASFCALFAADGDREADARVAQIADWLTGHQHPRTGFWQRDDGLARGELDFAMAGAAHVLHVYPYVGRPIPMPDRIVDSCLRLGYPGIRSACLDIDLVDVLVNVRRYGHRVAEIDAVLERLLVELLQIQHADGGFGDNYVTPHVLYGHRTPARASVTWTTWFRLATIGMIAVTLMPDERERWTFRNTLGTGFFSPRVALTGSAPPTRVGRYATPSRSALLAARRDSRFARQRATSRVRALLRGSS